VQIEAVEERLYELLQSEMAKFEE
jgi:regulator of replication initiation timing